MNASSHAIPFAVQVRIGVLAVLLLALTAPRLTIGYGADGDAVRNVAGAERFLRTGEYWPIRLPGSPLFDLLIAVADPWGGPAATNTMVLLFHLAGIAAFHRLCRGHPRRRLLPVWYAFTPLLLKNAATTMDYVPGLALLLASYAALKERRTLFAAVLLGAAGGMRISAILFILPATLYALRQGQSFRAAALHAAVAAVLAAGFNAPLLAHLIEQGFRLDLPHKPPVARALLTGYNALSLWGPAASLALLAAALADWRRLKSRLAGPVLRAPGPAAEATACLCFAGAFIALPDEPEYLLPVVPFAYLFLARFVRRRRLLMLIVLVLATGFITIDLKGGRSGQRSLQFKPAPGILVQDAIDRMDLEDLRSGLDRLPMAGKAVVLAGTDLPLTFRNPRVEYVPLDRFPDLRETFRYTEADAPFHRVGRTICKLKGRDVFLVVSLPKRMCERLRAQGYELCMFSSMAPSYALNLHGYDPRALGIRPIEVRGDGAFFRTAQPAASSR